jgi:hypothetical protein
VVGNSIGWGKDPVLPVSFYDFIQSKMQDWVANLYYAAGYRGHWISGTLNPTNIHTANSLLARKVSWEPWRKHTGHCIFRHFLVSAWWIFNAIGHLEKM